MNSDEDLSLDDIENKYLEGKRLSKEEQDRAIKAIDSVDLRDAITGCAAVLCSRDVLEAFKLEARKRFEEICGDLCQRDDKYKIEVLFTLLQIPIDELANSRLMQELAYCSLKADRFSLRANAVLVLERLHKLGDPVASLRIEGALNDPNEKVRTNALIALRKT